MHDCPVCGAACYCDLEDHENELAEDECVHACDPRDTDDAYEELVDEEMGCI